MTHRASFHRGLPALIILAFTGCLSGSTWADDALPTREASREALIQRLVIAQGLEESFAQQIAHSRENAASFGRQAVQQIIAQSDIRPDSDAARELDQVMAEYMAQCSRLFSPGELTALWARHYGEGLSQEDLQGILAYYESPIGQKDVQASRKSMVAYSQELSTLATTRVTETLQSFMAKIKEIAARVAAPDPVKVKAKPHPPRAGKPGSRATPAP